MTDTERIGGRDIRRTGWTTPARRCPQHDAPLELCFDETDFSRWSRDHQQAFNHDDDRVRWRCAECVGSWLENYFIEHKRRAAKRERLVLHCPSCASLRVTHGCVPLCCGIHRCIDCDARFEAVVELVNAGGRVPGERAVEPGPEPFRSSDAPLPEFRSGWCRDYRRCPDDDAPLELVFISWLDEAPTTLGWHCGACSKSWSESHFRHWRQWFVPDATPGAKCPSCGDFDLASLAHAADLAECASCGSQMRVSLIPYVPPPRSLLAAKAG